MMKKYKFEITNKELTKAFDKIGHLDTKDLSFDNIFHGKKRIIVPFDYGTAEDKSKMDRFVEYFQGNGYKLDLVNGIAEREVEIPEGPKKGQKQVRKEKIGKLIKKVADVEGQGDPFFAMIDKVFPRAVQMDDHGFGSFKNLLRFWETDAEAYRKNPELLNKQSKSNYFIVVSRAPIDVLRMSDFPGTGIESCHSPASARDGNVGEYYSSAIQEAAGTGLVAFLVKKDEDFENLDLEKEEIFLDPAREIEGIVPLSRIRLRKFVIMDKSRENKVALAVPEQKMYGKRVPEFEDKVVEWAKEVQKDEIEKVKEFDYARGHVQGGHYQDSAPYSLMDRFIGRDHNIRDYSTPDEDEDEDEDEVDYNERIIEQMDGLIRDADFDNVYVNSDNYDQEGMYSVGVSFYIELVKENEVSESEFSELEDIFDKRANRIDIKDIVDEVFNAEIGEDTSNVEVRLDNRGTWGRSIIADLDYDKYFDIHEAAPRELSYFLSNLKDFDKKYENVVKQVKAHFKKNGILKASQFDKQLAQLRQNEEEGKPSFENLEIVDLDEIVHIQSEKSTYVDTLGVDDNIKGGLKDQNVEEFVKYLESEVWKYAVDRAYDSFSKQGSMFGKNVKNLKALENVLKFSHDLKERDGKKYLILDLYISLTHNEAEKLPNLFGVIKFVDEQYTVIQKQYQKLFNQFAQKKGWIGEDPKQGVKQKKVTIDTEEQVKKLAEKSQDQEVRIIFNYVFTGDYSRLDKGNSWLRRTMHFDLFYRVEQEKTTGKNVLEIMELDTPVLFGRRLFSPDFSDIQDPAIANLRFTQNTTDEIIDILLHATFKEVKKVAVKERCEFIFVDVYKTEFDQATSVGKMALNNFMKIMSGETEAQNHYYLPVQNIKESKKFMVEQKLKEFLLKNKNIVELVKMMNPMDVLTIIQKEMGLCPKDTAEMAFGLFKKAYSEGLASGPNIEPNACYPVPNSIKRDNETDPEEKEKEFDHIKVDEDAGNYINNLGSLTPDFKKNQFPEPRPMDNDWPYDMPTVAAMDPHNKSRKQGMGMPLTSGKIPVKKQKKYIFPDKNPCNTDINLNRPGGDAGGIQAKFGKHSDGNISSSGRGWDRKGTPGWSSALGPFDLPDDEPQEPKINKSDEEPVENKEIDILNIKEEPPPLVASVPKFDNGRVDGGIAGVNRKGFRRR